jgi:hypothetical protein
VSDRPFIAGGRWVQVIALARRSAREPGVG